MTCSAMPIEPITTNGSMKSGTAMYSRLRQSEANLPIVDSSECVWLMMLIAPVMINVAMISDACLTMPSGIDRTISHRLTGVRSM